ncbi:MAG: HD domain-containing protein [bacterium]|nr:HD domain-containing protein [bacterium]
MDEINKLRIFNRLKSVYRSNSVNNRKESSAEHSWSCLILADFFLSKFPRPIDKIKVYELLMYHDVVEIEAGDTPLDPNLVSSDQKEREERATELLQTMLPHPLNDRLLKLFNEFIKQETVESRFAKAIDVLDAEIHELDYKEDWKGWSEKFLVEKKAHFFEEFPELKRTFETILKYLIQNNYFDN